MMTRAKRPRSARKLSTLDDFLSEQGKREEFEAVAVKEASAHPLVPSPLAGEGSESGAAKKNG
jgi:hypothetical protein